MVLKMSFIDKLKATCPHCQHQFVRLVSLKTIKFCPQCRLSLYKAPIVKNSLFYQDDVLNGATLFIAVYLLQQDNSTASMLLIGLVFDAVILLVGVTLALLIVKRLFFDDFTFFVRRYEPGVDKFEEVKRDIGNYDGNISSANNKVVSCLSCHSQRLQVTRWRPLPMTNKTSRSALTPSQDADNIKSYLRCLHCHTHYQIYDRQTPVYYSVCWYIPALLLYGISLFNIDRLIFSRLSLDLPEHDQYLLIACLIGLAAYFIIVAFNYHQQDRVNNLKLVKDSKTAQ